MTKKLSDFKCQIKNINRHNPRGMGMLSNIIAKDGWIGGFTVAANGETFTAATPRRN
jgi:hypothetical protein